MYHRVKQSMQAINGPYNIENKNNFLVDKKKCNNYSYFYINNIVVIGTYIEYKLMASKHRGESAQRNRHLNI